MSLAVQHADVRPFVRYAEFSGLIPAMRSIGGLGCTESTA